MHDEKSPLTLDDEALESASGGGPVYIKVAMCYDCGSVAASYDVEKANGCPSCGHNPFREKTISGKAREWPNNKYPLS